MTKAMRANIRDNPFRPMRPLSRTELQVAADISNLLLLLDIGHSYGLVDEKGRINAARCEEMLARARDLGMTPRTPGPAGS
jgi:hypothetical protein